MAQLGEGSQRFRNLGRADATRLSLGYLCQFSQTPRASRRSLFPTPCSNVRRVVSRPPARKRKVTRRTRFPALTQLPKTRWLWRTFGFGIFQPRKKRDALQGAGETSSTIARYHRAHLTDRRRAGNRESLKGLLTWRTPGTSLIQSYSPRYRTNHVRSGNASGLSKRMTV